jgi:uncharacterized protein (TIGR04255 family)
MAHAREHLQNAPIVEALIDFRVLRKEPVSAATFAGIGASIGTQYVRESSIQSIEARFGMDRGRLLEPWQSQTEIGWRYRTATEVAQFRVDGFTFSKLAKYSTWGEVSQSMWVQPIPGRFPGLPSDISTECPCRLSKTSENT